MKEQNKVRSLLKMLKISVDDEEALQKDIESILGMFDQIKKVEIEESDSKLLKKKITLGDLREDKVIDSNFRPEMKGKYFKVPSVSKKS